MKIKRGKEEPQMEPVIITLETQEEVDQLYALLNYIPIAEAIQVESNDWNKVHRYLSRLMSEEYNIWHKRLIKME